VQPFKQYSLEGLFYFQAQFPHERQALKDFCPEVKPMMKKNCISTLLVFFSIVCFIGAAHAAGHGKTRALKKGILLAAFGTSISKAQISYKNIERAVITRFPDIPIRWAYTSAFIRKKLVKQGQPIDSVEMALAKMMDAKFTHVAVQSLHTIAGWEFHDLHKNAKLFGEMAGGFDNIVVGNPLLAAESDFARVVNALLKNIPKSRQKTDAVILMGHGTSHPSNAAYAALMYHFQRKDPNVFVGTVEGFPEIDQIKEVLLAKNIKTAYLIPFMSVAGDHAMNDMAGGEEDSWKSILTNAGIRSVPVLKGTAEYDEIVEIWVDHLKKVLSRFD
jgi:sirohydrochlorin cobaltochelatase